MTSTNILGGLKSTMLVKLIWSLVRPIAERFAKETGTNIDDNLVKAMDDFMNSI